MLTSLNDLAKSAIFYGLAFSLMLATSLLFPVLGDLTIIVAMLTPMAATLLMLVVVTPDGLSKSGWASLGLHRFGFRAWLPALLIPLLVLGTAYVVAWGNDFVAFTLPPELEGKGPWLLPVMAVYLIVQHTLLTGAMAEEIGWRGYLLPRLTTALGRRWALPLTGLLQGIWHLPVILLTPLYHADGSWLIVVPMFLVAITIFGTIEGHLRLTTNSVWPSAILHAAHNVFWNLFSVATVAASPLVAEYLVGESGILPMLGYAAVVAIIVHMARRKMGRALPAAA